MRAGALRHLVEVQQPGGSRDAVGGRITTWTTIGTVYASIETLSGTEKLVAAQRQAETSHLIRLRYDPALAALDASWRILFGTRVFVIEEVSDQDERDRTVDLRCSEGLREE